MRTMLVEYAKSGSMFHDCSRFQCRVGYSLLTYLNSFHESLALQTHIYAFNKTSRLASPATGGENHEL